MSQAQARAVEPSEETRPDVLELLAKGVEAGIAQRAQMIEAANAKAIKDLQSKLSLYDFQDAARLVTAVKGLLEAANGELEATVMHQKAQMRGFDNYVQLRLHAPGMEMGEPSALPDDVFAFTVREGNVIALGRGQQNPRVEDVKKPVETPKPSVLRIEAAALLNRFAVSIGFKPISLRSKAPAVTVEKPKPTTAQQVDQIIEVAGLWCAKRGYVRGASFGISALSRAP